MPILKGPGTMKSNIHELTTGKVGSARKKAINTLAGKWGVSAKEARVKQAWIIAKANLKTPTKKHKLSPKIIHYALH